jgi:UDPglucose--hexose-1-phosphate uridylyltransferase
MSEIRKDPIADKWVIIDSTRIFHKLKPCENYPKDISKCPFCLGNEFMTKPEILAYSNSQERTPNKEDWTVRVIPNNNPILQAEGILKSRTEGMYSVMESVGAHEIIIETPDHYAKPSDVTQVYYKNLYKIEIARIKDLRKDLRLEQIMIFKNYGLLANAVLEHPHSQLIAMPLIPKIIKEEINTGKNYFAYKGKCVFCDMISQELSDKSRIVFENDMFVALCPYASRYPFETWILPKKHGSDFDIISDNEIESLAQITKIILSKLQAVLDDCSYNCLLHTGPLKESNVPFYHWHIKIKPNIINAIGFEWDSGLYVNSVIPEEAAKNLREI